MAGPPVTVVGLRELRAAFAAIEKSLPRELTKALRVGAAPAAVAAAAAAPRAAGDLAGSVRVRANQRGAAVGSPLLHAPIIHFGRVARVSGGKVAPHIRHLTPVNWLIDPVEATAPAVEAATGKAIQALLDRTVTAT